MDRETIIIGILIVIIIILLIMNFLKVDNKYSVVSESKTEHLNQDGAHVNKQFVLPQSKHKLCLYHTNWCGACARFKPTWNQFLSQNNGTIQTDSIDCDKDTNACLKIKGYPTIILHKKDGTNIEFTGNRSVEAINDFIKNNTN